MNAWRTDILETDHAANAKNYGTGSFVNFVSEISEGVSSQLHAGIMKAARRVLLDEIISNVISEFVTTKKANRHLKLGAVNQATKSCSSDEKMVSTPLPKNSSLCKYIFFLMCLLCFR